MNLSDFDYTLPAELIAQVPAAERTGSRLLVVGTHSLSHRQFAELPQLLAAGDLLVVNDTRVIKARLQAVKDTGGAVEVLLERPLDDTTALCQVRASKPLKAGRFLLVGETDSQDGGQRVPQRSPQRSPQQIEVLGREGVFYRLAFPGNLYTFLERYGAIPLPPYVERAAGDADSERYQTVYAHSPGAVAAPTAGLHFDEVMLARLQAGGVEVARVTLHVGAGTFAPVRVENLAEHRMHREVYEVPPETVAAVARTRKRGGRVVAVGTTVVRSLESAAAGGELQATRGETELFITPATTQAREPHPGSGVDARPVGFRFRVVDRLITNFHLPRSTLLMLVSAFSGHARMMDAYRQAVAARYRFFSYGDAMLLDRVDPQSGVQDASPQPESTEHPHV